MRRFLILVLLAMSMVSAMPALAADPDAILVELQFRNYAAEEGTTVDINGLEKLIADVDAVERRLYFVVLRSDPSGGNDLFAGRLIGEQLDGTVVVISPNEIGASSSVHDAAAVADAVDAAFDDFLERDDIGAFEAFAGRLPDSNRSATDSTGGGGGAPFLAFMLVVVGGIVFVIWRNSRRDRQIVEGRLDEAKEELKTQIDVIANEILDLSDRVTIAENEGALAYFREASDTYSEVSKAAETAVDLGALEELSDRLDRARWQLEAAEALIEDRDVPAEPEDRPAHCFFDPAHRAGVEEAEIRTAAGSKMVGVCRDCAAKLRNGETPTPRSINVGGRPIPAPRAPRSYGGGGLDWLSTFSVLLGGRDMGASYDFGRSSGLRRRSRGSAGSALGRLGSRNRSAPRSAPRATGGTRSKPTSRQASAPRVKGRARRRR